MLTVVQPSRGGCTAVFAGSVVPVAGAGSSSRVVNYRIPTINSTPAMIAAMIGTLLAAFAGVPRTVESPVSPSASVAPASTPCRWFAARMRRLAADRVPLIVPGGPDPAPLPVGTRIGAIRTAYESPLPPSRVVYRDSGRPSSLLTLRRANDETILSIQPMTVFIAGPAFPCYPPRCAAPACPANAAIPPGCHAGPTHPARLTSIGDSLANRRSGDADRSELDTHPRPHRPGGLGYRVLPGPLTTSTHHDQVAVTRAGTAGSIHRRAAGASVPGPIRRTGSPPWCRCARPDRSGRRARRRCRHRRGTDTIRP